jgi:hypothetical protein
MHKGVRMSKPDRKKSMTCIAIAKNKSGKLMIAGDRRSSWGWSKAEEMEVPKINKKDGILLGATGNGDLCSLFVEDGGFNIPEKKTDCINTYMYHVFKKAVHKFLMSQYFSTKDVLALPPDSYVEVVIGIEGQAWSLTVLNPLEDSDHYAVEIMVSRVTLPYTTGCGGIPALAVLKHEKNKKGYLTKQDLEDSVKIAGQISPGCDEKVDIIIGD